MQIPILNGIYADPVADFRTSYPRNLVPVPKQTGISQGYLRPADGIKTLGTGPGVDRGGILWRGVCYRVMGTKFVSVSSGGVVTELGDVGEGTQATLDYSFDRLAIASGGRLYYWDGTTLRQVTDPDLSTVIDMLWVDGYFMTTDGTSLIVTELSDPFEVNPLKYGSSESDPDPVKSLLKLRNEVYALNRYTIEVFQNVGGDNFPFARIDGALIPRGAIGTHACNLFQGAIAFLGSGRDEPPSVWLGLNGETQKLATREIEQILQGFTESELAQVVMEARADKGHEQLLMHLPDNCWVYDAAASKIVGEPVWFSLDSGVGVPSTYRARNLVWVYDRWMVGDPTSSSIGQLVDDVSTHHGHDVGWEFSTAVVYNEGRGAVFHELELVALPGRVTFGDDPVIWTSYSVDGETWSIERAAKAGRQGQRAQRIAWRRLGFMRQWRVQRFRGLSDAHVSFARLEAQLEPLNA